MANFIGVVAYQGSSTYTGSAPGATQHGQVTTNASHNIYWGEATHYIDALDHFTADGVLNVGASNAGTINLGQAGNAVIVKGNLIVDGTSTAISSDNVLLEDNHLYLNSGYTTAVAQTAGLIANYLPTATVDTVAATGFVAGVAATSNPTVETAGTATFSVGDFIQISGTPDNKNDGLFEVLSHVAETLTIRGVGTTSTVEDFTQNQFITDTTVQGAITKVNVSVLRSGVNGVWEIGIGAASGLTFNDIQAGASTVSLDDAYDNGRTITADVGSVVVNGSGTSTEALSLSATGTIEAMTATAETGGVAVLSRTGDNVSVDAVSLTMTGTHNTGDPTPKGVLVDYSGVTALSTATDFYAMSLKGFTNAGAGVFSGIQIDSAFDIGLEAASDIKCLDNVSAYFGSDNDGVITYDETTNDRLDITCSGAGGMKLDASVGAVDIDSTAAATWQTSDPAASTASTTIAVRSGNATTADSGAVSFASGTTTTSGTTGAVTVASGASAAASGAVSMASGSAIAAASGVVDVKSGTTTTSGATGAVTVASGDSAAASGAVSVASGDATGAASGDITVQTGTGTTRGDITLSGNALSLDLDAGSQITLTGTTTFAWGAGTPSGTPGAGSLWIDTTNGVLYVYDNTLGWIKVGTQS